MSIVTVKRPPRADPPDMPDGQVELQEPPVMAEPAQPDLRAFMMVIPMGLGMGGMFLLYGMSNRSPVMYVMGIVMAVGMVGMGAMQIGRNAAERKTKMRSERRDFLRYITQIRRKARKSAQEQRQSVLWDNPDPGALWSIAMGNRIWERRASHEDFGRVRIGLGVQGSSVTYVAPATKPIEDLEPLSSISLRRFSEAYRTVAGVPIAVGTRSFTSIEVTGESDRTLGLARAMIAQLVTFHAPDELRIAVLCSDAEREKHWDWVKWLPHNAHPTAEDAAGPVRLFAADYDELVELLGADVMDRGDHDKSVVPSVAEPYVLVVAHHTAIPDGSRLIGEGIRNVGLLDLTNQLPGGPRVLRLTADGDRVEFPTGATKGIAKPDSLSVEEVETLARVLAPKRTSGTLELVDEPMSSDFELTALLGVRDPYTFDVAGLWRGRQAQRARLQVPIGVTENGEVVELDLKESAQGGMGPHGLLIGATGSGKSELLRTLVCALAMTHSSEILNLVLVDFKGGATFVGMERLPHTSAVITNLQDELPLVDRMQDSINGEMIRRQELLRAAGYASLFDYEKARAAGASLAPFPVLLVVVDEFSELLSSKPEFMDLFVSIGRLGRSLGVHLLLASQRLDEGRINRVEGHLSYRIALRTFSSMESRSVIGVGSAYELPSEPGNGFLKVDITSLIRFKGAYVSGPYERTTTMQDDGEGRTRALVEVVPFTSSTRSIPRRSADPEPAAVMPAEADVSAPESARLMDVLIDRLVGAGPPARQVWLPPLAEAPTLDSLLPSLVPDPMRGMTVEAAGMQGRLRVPVGVVDRPSEQLRDLLIADLNGAEGHIGIAGAPQSGKSTLLRTLVLALALTHTPDEVQFYGLDFGGGGIMSLVGLPHVGSIATRMERDRVVRTIQELRQVLERREAAFAEHGFESIGAYLTAREQGRIKDTHGRVFLIVDGWFTMKQDFMELDTAFGELASRGLSFGIHVIVTANRWSEVRTWVRDLLGTKLELRLGDSMESEVGSRKALTVPHLPGRGITSTGLHFLVALPRLDGRMTTDDLPVATKTIVEEIATFWPGRPAPPVRMLPARLPAVQLPAPQPDFKVCLGLDEQRLAPAWHDFLITPHLLVMGDNETGKTNVLRLVLKAIRERYTPAQAKVVIGDSRRDLDNAVPPDYRVGYAITAQNLTDLAKQASVSLSRRLPGMDISSERLRKRDWWEGPELFVIVDDYELLGNPSGVGSVLDPLLPMIAQGAAIGFHLIIARSTSGAMRAMMDPAIRRMWELGNPATLLSYPKDEGRFLGEAPPRKLPPGRAQLVTRRSIRLIQTGEVDQDVR